MFLGSIELRSKHVLCNSGAFISSESQTLLVLRKNYDPEVLVSSPVLLREELSINMVKYVHFRKGAQVKFKFQATGISIGGSVTTPVSGFG
jgi:hypothetical protein